ncbi:hypothetical protein ACFLZB_03880 [Nanoarchaeota archaeon]
MVFEQLFNPEKIAKRPEFSLYLGVAYTLVSFLTSYLLFKSVPSFVGISTILFTVILTIPLAVSLFRYEEELELKKDSFFKKHKIVIDFFIYFFIGAFIVFFVLSLAMPNMIFSESQLYGQASEAQKAVESKGLGLPPLPDGMVISSIFKNNLYVMLIAFVLSLFYGSGALFLMILNGSIFASTLANVVRAALPAGSFLAKYSFVACNLGIMFFHMVPEVGGYLLAAIAGGILSKALLREKFLSQNFFKVLKSSGILLGIAIVVLYVAALIEVKVSRKLFLANVCLNYTGLILILVLFFITIIVILETMRKKRLSYDKIYISKKIKKRKGKRG